MEPQLIKHDVHLLQGGLSRLMRLWLPCVALLAASGAFAANAAKVPALQVELVQGPVQVLRLGQSLPLHAGDRVVARDVVKLGKDARLSLSLANRGVFQLMDAGEISIEQLPPAAAPAVEAGVGPIPMPVIVNLEHGDMRLLWHPEGQAQSLYVYFARRRVALMPGEYFFGQQDADTRICVVEGQAETMTIAAGQRQLIPAQACESQQDQTTRILALNAATWPIMRQWSAFPDQGIGDASGGPAVLQVESKAAKPSRVAAMPVPSSPAPATTNGGKNPGAGWAVNVASYSATDDARRQQQKLQASGYRTVVVPAEVDGHVWYRVQVGGFPTPTAAHAAAEALETKLGYRKPWVLQRP